MPRYGYKPRQAFKPVEAGMHVAWLTQFIDLGTHLDTGGAYGPREKRKARFTWLLPDQLMDDGRPMSISNTMALSPHEKSNFRKMCSSWQSRVFSDKDFLEWDERELFSIPCFINVAHREGDDGSIYAIVQDVMPLPRNQPATPLPEGVLYIYLSLDPDRFDAEEHKKLSLLPEKTSADLCGKIESSPEWAALMSPETAADYGSNQDSGPEPQWHTDEPLESENPAPPPPQPRAAAPAHPSRQNANSPPPIPAGRPMTSSRQPVASPTPQQPAARAAPPAQPRQAPPAQQPQRSQQAGGAKPQPAPPRPTPGPNSTSARAVAANGHAAPPPQQRRAPPQQVNDPDLEEAPF